MVAEPKISVIIPIYNTATYLPRCLDSVLNNTYRNLEVICVDDGSTDGSADIAESYAGGGMCVLFQSGKRTPEFPQPATPDWILQAATLLHLLIRTTGYIRSILRC